MAAFLAACARFYGYLLTLALRWEYALAVFAGRVARYVERVRMINGAMNIYTHAPTRSLCHTIRVHLRAAQKYINEVLYLADTRAQEKAMHNVRVALHEIDKVNGVIEQRLIAPDTTPRWGRREWLAIGAAFTLGLFLRQESERG